MSNAMAEKCCGVIWNGAGYRNFICGKKGKVQRDGKWYCGRCDPDAVSARRAKTTAKWPAEIQAYRDKRKAERIRDARAAAFPVLVKALRDLLQYGSLDDGPGSKQIEAQVDAALAQADAIEKEQP